MKNTKIDIQDYFNGILKGIGTEKRLHLGTYIDEDLKINEFRKRTLDYVQKELDNLNNIFSKHGVKITNLEAYSPKEYNFKDDSITIEVEYEKGVKPEYHENIKHYIENIRVKSYDGYMSFEPLYLEEVQKDDIAYFYAIGKKINEKEKQYFLDFVEEIEEIRENCFLYLERDEDIELDVTGKLHPEFDKTYQYLEEEDEYGDSIFILETDEIYEEDKTIMRVTAYHDYGDINDNLLERINKLLLKHRILKSDAKFID